MAHESMNLPTQLDGVYVRIERTWKALPIYTKIARCKQKDGEDIYEYAGRLMEDFKAHGGLPEDAAASPYQSQLKQALKNGFKPQISDFIHKHDVNHSTDSVPQIMNYGRHAEEVTKKKGKRNLTAAFNLLTTGEEYDTAEIFYHQNGGRGQGGRFRGKGRGSIRGRGGPPTHDRCYICDKLGHFARKCRSRKATRREPGF